MIRRHVLVVAIAAMAAVVVASNILVQYPVSGTFLGVPLGDVLTYGAFTYPVAFLVTDVVNRLFGPELARRVVFSGFAVAVVMSAILAAPRIVLASGTAFLLAQLFDVSIFERLRYRAWWQAPLTSSILASALDTAIFFTLAFAALIPFGQDGFATEVVPLFGIDTALEAPRWVSWAIADYAVKLLISAFALGPYRALTARWIGARA